METISKEQAFLEKFGQRIALLRMQQGLSQDQLAELAYLDLATISQIENGIDDFPLH